MKHIILLTLCVLACITAVSVVHADEDAKYQVDITIRYNAVSPEGAAKIAQDIAGKYTDADSFEFSMKSAQTIKASDGTRDWYISPPGGDYIFLPNGPHGITLN